MTEINALTDQAEPTYADMLDEQESQWGGSGLDEEGILDEIDEMQEEGSTNEETVNEGEPNFDTLLEDAPREGTGDVLNRLVETDPGAARLMRGMQRQMSQMFNERGEVKDVLDRLVSLEEDRAGVSSEAAAALERTPEEALAARGSSLDQVENFEAVVDALGLAYGKDLEATAKAESANDREAKEALRGIELYGSDFGYVDEEGAPQINPDFQAAMDAKLQDLTDPEKGVTTLDLFQLVNPQTSSQGPAGRNTASRSRAKAPARRRASSRANTVKRTNRPSGVRIYDAKRGDSGDDVLDRAWALSKREELDYENF